MLNINRNVGFEPAMFVFNVSTKGANQTDIFELYYVILNCITAPTSVDIIVILRTTNSFFEIDHNVSFLCTVTCVNYPLWAAFDIING